jgi:hypothetical protein
LAKKENLMAYFGTGVLLSVLPFLLIGGGAFWLYRQRKARPDSFAASESALPEEGIFVEKGSS